MNQAYSGVIRNWTKDDDAFARAPSGATGVAGELSRD
jgi:hypothetical protein